MPETVETTPANSIDAWTTSMPDVMADGNVRPPGQAAAPAVTPDPVPPEPAPTPAPAPDAKEPPKEPTADDDDEKWPRSAEDWKRRKSKQEKKLTSVSQERDAIKAEKDTLAAEIEKLRGTIPTKELDDLKKEREELQTRLNDMDEVVKRVNLAEHPKFKAYYDGLTKSQISMAKDIVGADKANEIERILSMPEGDYRDTQLEELSSDLPTIKQGRLVNILNRISEIQSERAGELSKAKEKVAQITASEQQIAKAQNDAKEKFVSTTLDEIASSDEFKPFMDTAAVDLAKRVILGGTKNPSDYVKTVTRGLMMPKVLLALKAEQDKTSALEKTIAGMKAATPGPGGGDEPANKEQIYTNPRTAIEDWIGSIPDVSR